MSNWSVVYERAIKEDGSLWFPERLTYEFLESQRRLMGSYIFANQYQNEVIPADKRIFKTDWLKYYKTIPQHSHIFAFIDPAISQSQDSDYTALNVIAVDQTNQWYVICSQRYRINPTEIVELCIKVTAEFKPMIIGIEDVAYQKALLYMIHEESRRRGMIIPVMGVRPDTTKSKEMRILGLVPRFEFGRVFLKQGLKDLEDELLKFPRGKHDDLIDSLSYLEQIAVVPGEQRSANVKLNPIHPDYERQYIQTAYKRTRGDDGGEED